MKQLFWSGLGCINKPAVPPSRASWFPDSRRRPGAGGARACRQAHDPR